MLLGRKIVASFDWFIPQWLIEGTKLDDLLRARIFVCILLSNIVISVCVYLYSLFFNEFSRHVLFIGGLGIGGVFLFFGSLLNFFRYSGNVVLFTNLYATAGYFMIVVNIVLTGGLADSPFTILLFSIPILLYAVTNRWSGVIWLFIVISTLVACFIAEKNGIQFQQIYSEQHRNYILVTNAMVVFLVMLASIYIIRLLKSIDAATDKVKDRDN